MIQELYFFLIIVKCLGKFDASKRLTNGSVGVWVVLEQVPFCGFPKETFAVPEHCMQQLDGFLYFSWDIQAHNSYIFLQENNTS